MILTIKQPEQGDYLVAQDKITYECLVFSETGDPFDYDSEGIRFQGFGRYKPMDGSLPSTESLLRNEFGLIQRTIVVSAAKVDRDRKKQEPINGFDFDNAAQANIIGAINSFDQIALAAIAEGHPEDGTIPWVLADNTLYNVSKPELIELQNAGAVRAMLLHIEYNTIRAATDTLWSN